MGVITREQLIDMGFNQPEYWDLYFDQPQTIEGRAPECPDGELDALMKLKYYMIEHDVYEEYEKKNDERLFQPVKEWMAEHNLESDE